jgi:hypothetical protein
LIQLAAKSVDGQLRRHGTAFVASHTVGDDVEPPQSHAFAAHAILVLVADGSFFGQLTDLPFLG